jgi:hypothetical protein
VHGKILGLLHTIAEADVGNVGDCRRTVLVPDSTITGEGGRRFQLLSAPNAWPYDRRRVPDAPNAPDATFDAVRHLPLEVITRRAYHSRLLSPV